MPDPKDPTPVRVVKRGSSFVVVDADGKKLPDTDSFDDSAKASGVAARVNASWKRAKSERKSKGAPAITEEGLFAHLSDEALQVHHRELAGHAGTGSRKVLDDLAAAADEIRRREGKRKRRLGEALDELEERAWPLTGGTELHLKFDPRLHRRDRLGRFVETLRKLQFAQHGSTVELPHGVRVQTHMGAFEVHSGSGKVRLRSLHAAAAQALTHVDEAEISRGADANALHPSRMDELKAARLGAMVEPYSGVLHIEQLIKQERKAHQARNPAVPFSNRHGRTSATKRYWKSRFTVDSQTGMRNLDRALAQLRNG